MVRVSPLKNGGESLAPTRAAAFCAVGNPVSFFKSLRQAGYELCVERSFPDHHVYSQDEIDALNRAAKETGANALITTAKDAVKLRALGFSIPCFVMEIEVAVDDVDGFGRLLTAAI
jgi:tetraacyldisaccharide 4'-kinase